MIPFVYSSFLLGMILILYKSGLGLRQRYEIFSVSGLCAILAYTLNEGLRFGRGIDYNVYWSAFNHFSQNETFEKSIVFGTFINIVKYLGFPFQTIIIILSFMFIFGTINLLKSYKKIVPFALPLFVLLSMGAVENMIRWFLAFSIFMLALSNLMHKKCLTMSFVFFSFVACSIHIAFLPIPIIFYLIYKISIPLHYGIVLFGFFSIYFLFDNESLIKYVDVFQFITSGYSGYDSYGNNAEYWLAGGFSGNDFSGKIGTSTILFLCLLCYMGYNSVKRKNLSLIYSYNLFSIGLLLFPISRKIELAQRYQEVFFFFRAIICANIIYQIYGNRKKLFSPMLKYAFLILFLHICSSAFITPFYASPSFYMYVWNKKYETADKMLDLWLKAQSESAERSQKK